MLLTIAVLASVTYVTIAATIGRPLVIRDAFAYNASAMRLLHTGVYEYNPDVTAETTVTTGPSAFTMPGYTLFLSAIHRVTPDAGDAASTILAAQPWVIAGQLLLAVTTACIISYAALRTGGPVTGWTAGLFAVAYLPFGINATVSLTETLTLALISVVMLALVELFRTSTNARGGDAGWAVALGVAAGLCTLVRPTIALWLAIPLLTWLGLRRHTPSHAWKVAGVAVTCYIAVMLPWVARNAVALDSFVPLTTSASTPLLDSVGGATFTEAEQDLMTEAEASGRDPHLAVALSRLRSRWIVSPGGFLAWKASTLWTGISNFTNLPVDVLADVQSTGLPAAGSYADAGDFLRVDDVAFYNRVFTFLKLYHRLLLLLAVIGLLLGWRKPVIAVLASVPMFYAVTHTVILFMVRYFYPAMPAILILAAFGAVRLWGVFARVQRTETAAEVE